MKQGSSLIDLSSPDDKTFQLTEKTISAKIKLDNMHFWNTEERTQKLQEFKTAPSDPRFPNTN